MCRLGGRDGLQRVAVDVGVVAQAHRVPQPSAETSFGVE